MPALRCGLRTKCRISVVSGATRVLAIRVPTERALASLCDWKSSPVACREAATTAHSPSHREPERSARWMACRSAYSEGAERRVQEGTRRTEGRGSSASEAKSRASTSRSESVPRDGSFAFQVRPYPGRDAAARADHETDTKPSNECHDCLQPANAAATSRQRATSPIFGGRVRNRCATRMSCGSQPVSAAPRQSCRDVGLPRRKSRRCAIPTAGPGARRDSRSARVGHTIRPRMGRKATP